MQGLVKAISDELHASGSGKVSVTLRLTAMMDALLVLILASLLGVRLVQPVRCYGREHSYH